MTSNKTKQPLNSKKEEPGLITGKLNTDSQASILLEQIIVLSTQPRRYFDSEALEQLIESIKQHGILQPLLVRLIDGGKYELVAGERRYRAALSIGLKEVPVVIRELDDNTAFQLAIIENLLREDLNPIEETESILQLLAFKLGKNIKEITTVLYRLQRQQKKASTATHHVMGKVESDSITNKVIDQDEGDSNPETHNVMGAPLYNNLNPNQPESVNPDLTIVKEVFDSLGLMTWESFVKNRLPLLNLPEEILEALRRGAIEYTKAKIIAKIPNLEQRTAFLEQATANNWSLSEIKQRITSNQAPTSTNKKDSNDYIERFAAVTTKIRKSGIWSDPKKRKQIEKLLSQLETLTTE
ncbi:chromosome partitioning protein ParB [Dulcicalothrix desertica PCC 7102]|uniref:Chromosome partitioning protein ParB n=1 Tax=Dulcicalothrix desertica PCC 7102 TaxID=232991 RepID=A0A3S1C3L0_9CYAN|nr:ParB/RepB/Spo0J family partition protein [Dulcicalothrix desertica]RUS94658.1 chromosome partitioning protein ParB [Dulcicalothrix desertica PCC 7102]TWH62551.1 ParB family chromosome partitioning protein [Dulcicalothrix desertica PCC 7102]